MKPAKTASRISTPAEVRDALIKSGIVKAGKVQVETIPCDRCGTPFDRMVTHRGDKLCGNRDCKAIAAALREQAAANKAAA